MPVKSSIALLFHLLLAGWMGFALSGSITGIHHRKDFSSKKIHDPLIARVRKSRNVYETNDLKLPQPTLFIRRAPSNHAVKLRDSVLLECDAGGSPQPTIHWLKDGVEIFQDESLFTNEMPSDVPASLNGIGRAKSRLFIDCMSPKDEGVYTCVADTPYQRVSEASYVFLSRDLPAEVNPSCLPQKMSLALGQSGQPARIHMWTSHLSQDEDSNVVLYCRATGEPTPSIRWTRLDNDEEKDKTISSGSKYQVLDNGDLLIRLATWAERGLYKCAAKNVFGEDSVTAFFYPTKIEDK